jgi:hypothetical protein
MKVTAFATGTSAVGIPRILGRVVSLVTEVAKTTFYSIVSLFTLGTMGNKERLWDHCKLFSLNAAGLVAQPIQCIISTLAIGIGIISPKAGYKMLQGGSTPLGWITSHEKKILEEYKTPLICQRIGDKVKSFASGLFKNSSHAIGTTFLTLINEFPEALSAGLVAPISLSKQFHLFSANPKTLNEEQRNLRPILLLNGNYSHQGTFLPLLHALEKSGNKRPVFTVNLPPNCDEEKYTAPTLESIKKKYQLEESEQLEIDIVGHSMGSFAIYNLLWSDSNYKVGRAITLGTPWFHDNGEPYSLPENVMTKIFDITGAKDCLTSTKSMRNEEQKKDVNTGHLGLLFHPKSIRAIRSFLHM